ncbi:MAG: hypothetical protein FK734_05980 [Asgard group archaeon]|nr:hypothetical protein [Asgard group archaeon]
MKFEKFREYLIANKADEDTINLFIDALNEYEKYLAKQEESIETVDVNELVNYTELLVKEDENQPLGFLRALLSYSRFAKRNDFIEKAIDIAESYMAMDTLYERIKELHGEEIRDEIFSGLKIPPLGVHPEKKPEFTKIILKRIEDKLGEEKVIELLKPCLHEGLSGDMEKDRKDYHEMGIDAFLIMKSQEQIKNFEKHRDEGTANFAQIVDDKVVEYVKNDPHSALGKREGKIIYLTKIPYQAKKSIEAEDEKMKRFYACFCPWVRGAIKNGTEHEVSKHFCQCSGGWYKDYFEQLFEQPIRIEPVETALSGVPYCKFAVYLPDNVIIKPEKE